MHHICQGGFHDLRAHSTILPTASGSFLLTLCTYRLVGTDAKLFKTYIYRHCCSFVEPSESKPNSKAGTDTGPIPDSELNYGQCKIIITYEHELMPDLDKEFVEVIHPPVNTGTGSGTDTGGIENPMSLDEGTGYRGFTDGDEGDVLSIILGRVQSMNPKRVLTVGPMYLIYEIAIEALMAEDSLVEFFSRTLCYFKTKVHNNLQHEEKLIINRKMHIIISAMLVMSSNITESASCFMRLLDPPQALKQILESNRLALGAGGGGLSQYHEASAGEGFHQAYF